MEARDIAVKKKNYNTWLEGTTLEALVAAPSTTPQESAAEGLGARGRLTELICAAFLTG